jgi:hypothetical protein
MKSVLVSLAPHALSVAVLSQSGCGGLLGGGKALTIAVTTPNNLVVLNQGESVQVFADIHHTGGNRGVTWSLSGTTCPDACGSLDSATANPVTYLAPASVAASFDVTITAAAAADPTKTASVTITVNGTACPAGREGLLNGGYAFLVRGADRSGAVAIAGSFVADGAGGVTAGIVDVNAAAGRQTNTLTAAGSSYTAGADGRGCLTLASAQGTRLFRFAVGAITGGIARRGHIVGFDCCGDFPHVEGVLNRQDLAGAAVGVLSGSYALALVGADASAARIATAGVIGAAAGLLSSGVMDTNAGGTMSSATGVTGSYGVGVDGRGTLALKVTATVTRNFVLYAVSSAEAFALSSDVLSADHPLQSGRLVQQSPGTFDNGSLGSRAVFEVTGSGPSASIGLATPDGNGNLGLVLDVNVAGQFAGLQSATGTYTVASNSRTATSGLGSHSPILYLIESNRAFVLGTDTAVSFGTLEQQSPPPIDNASLSGAFFYGTQGDGSAKGIKETGSMSFDGRGHESGVADQSVPGGVFPNQSFTDTYAFAADSLPPGRGTLDANQNSVAYFISPAKVVFIGKPALRPRVYVVEK